MKYAYLVMMIFSTGSAGDVTQWNHPCEDMACVREVISHAGESKTLVRLRVYEGPVEVHKVTNVPMGTPLMDLWFQ